MSEQLQSRFAVRVITKLRFVAERIAETAAEKTSVRAEKMIRQRRTGVITPLRDIAFRIKTIEDARSCFTTGNETTCPEGIGCSDVAPGIQLNNWNDAVVNEVRSSGRVLLPRSQAIAVVASSQHATVRSHSIFRIEGQGCAAVVCRIAVAVMREASAGLLIVRVIRLRQALEARWISG